MPPAAQTSMHSLMMPWTILREALSFAAPPKVVPQTVLIPENEALMRSLLQRVPRKF